QLELVVRDVRANFLELRLGRLEILALPLHQLSPVLDRLLEPRDLRADAIVVSLHGVHRFAPLGDFSTQALRQLVHLALRGERSLEGLPLLVQELILNGELGLQRLHSKGEQLRRDAALLRLELLVPLGGIRLSLQVVELLLDLVSQIGEALEVLPRMTNAVLGLAAPLLVLRDARRFL